MSAPVVWEGPDDGQEYFVTAVDFNLTPDGRLNDNNENATVETAAQEEQQSSSAIPVDEEGRPLYEQAKPEVTLKEMTAKHGAEKA